MEKAKDIQISFTKQEMKESIAILDQETKKREEDIRQRTELLCASLRAQAKAQIDAMPIAILSLTLKEYCQTYKGSAQYFLEQQQKNPRRLTMKRVLHIEDKSKKRSKAASIAEEETENKEKELKTEEEKPAPISPITPIVEPLKPTIAPIIEPPGSAIRKPPAVKLPRASRVETLKPAPESPTISTIDSPKPSISKPPTAPKKKTDFGPLFIHMERPNHPKLSLRLNPEHTIEKGGQFTITAPIEILKQLDEDQKARVRDQIQSLQDRLEDLKRRL